MTAGPGQAGPGQAGPGYARARLAVGIAGMVASAALVRRDRVGRWEAAVFRRVNGLPDPLFGPVWVVMQSGALGAAPAAAALALRAGRRGLARRLLFGGSTTWALSKLVKVVVARPRPEVLLPGTASRGRPAAGLGYVSGHTGVAVALGVAAFPHLRRRGRLATLAVVPAVGLARMYVGAHLPLDVVGGASLGLAVDAALALRSAGGCGR